MQRGQFVRRGRASAPISSIIIIKYWHNELLRGAKPVNTPPKQCRVLQKKAMPASLGVPSHESAPFSHLSCAARCGGGRTP